MKIFKLKDISEFIRNGVTIKQDISSKEGIPITRIETISKGTIDFNKLGYSNIFKIEKYKEWLLKKGDILISHINSEKHLGKSAIYLDNNYDIIHGMNLLCIRAIDKKVFPEYLQLFFKTNQYKKQIKKITKKSVNQASFSVNDFKEILITVPDLNIQEKIIKKIKVLEKILENNKLKLDYLSELTKSLFTKIFGDIRINNKNWKIKKIGEVVETQYGTSKKASAEFSNGIPILRMNNIRYSGEMDYEDLKYIKLDNNEKEKFLLKKGDLLFNRTNSKELVGKTGLFNLDTPMVFAGYLIRIKPSRQVNSKFLLFFMNSEFMKKVLYNKAKNIVGMANINAKELEDFSIILPPIELQNKFAERVEKIEKLSFEIEKSIKEAENLYNSLINKYFD